jgi:LytS/YehU family sensor histidine kinase
MVLASRFMDTTVLPALTQPDKLPDIPIYSSIFNGIVSAIKVIAAATVITLGKYWWKKQKEKETLEREKINAELQLLKAQIHPGFLFTALNNIYVFSLAASPRAPELLLKLSDLLSYMLYECDQAVVSLEKEIARMKDYIILEKIRMESIEMEQSVTGDLSGKLIAPLLLLPFIENSFKHSSKLMEQAWVNMDVTVEGDILTMKLANGMMPGSNGDVLFENGLANVQKRLTLLYPQKHELKISRELEMLVVLLKIQIGEKPLIEPEQTENPGIDEPLVYQPTLYAAQ